MDLPLRGVVGYLFGVGFVLAGIATWWVGGNAILVGKLTGGVTLIIVGLLLLFAGILVLPSSRRMIDTRLGITLSTLETVLLSVVGVALAVFVLFAALIALLTS
jgi:uncharacterized membrane protein YidH (DUF202 family)